MTQLELSIVSPVYRAAGIVDSLAQRITEEAEKITDDFEVILVEDGSPDDSWTAIEQVCASNPKVKGLRLSRNFGQHPAISAGLEHTRGKHVILIDCDLQDNPKYFSDLFNEAKKGFDIVIARKAERSHPYFKNLFALIFFKLFNWLSDNPASSLEGTYSIISRKVVNAYLRLGDYHRHYLPTLRWLGFQWSHVEVVHDERKEGKSSYTFGKLVDHALVGIISQSDKMLRIGIGLGLVYFIASVLGSLYLITSYFLYGYKEGWASTFVLLLLSTGLILLTIGILGLYLGRMFDQVRNRPVYLIDETVNFHDTKKVPGGSAKNT